MNNCCGQLLRVEDIFSSTHVRGVRAAWPRLPRFVSQPSDIHHNEQRHPTIHPISAIPIGEHVPRPCGDASMTRSIISTMRQKMLASLPRSLGIVVVGVC